MDNKTIKLIRTGLVVVIALIALVFFVQILTNSGETEADQSSLSSAINGFLYATYVVLGIALIMTVLTWLAELLSHPKKLVQFAISAGLFLLVILIAKFALASNEPETFGKLSIDGNTSNWVDTGLYTFYILGAIAILLMFLSPVLSAIGVGGGSNATEEEYSSDEETEE